MSKLRRTALYTYDQMKRLVRIEDEHGVTEYAYDEQGLRTKAQYLTKSDDDELSYADLNALVTSLTKVLAQYAAAKYELEQNLNALVTQYGQEVERLTARIDELEARADGG